MVLELRNDFQDNARRHQPNTPLTDRHSETDEMCQNAGKKGTAHTELDDPPRWRANNRRWVDEVPTPIVVHPSSEQLGVKADKFVCR